jgi:hypothetical protein
VAYIMHVADTTFGSWLGRGPPAPQLRDDVHTSEGGNRYFSTAQDTTALQWLIR